MKNNLESSLTAVVSNIDDLDVQKRSMFKQVQELYAVMISKAKKWFADETTEIDTVYHSQLSVLKQMHAILNTVVSRIESSIAQINTLRSKTVDTKHFLRIQEILSDMKQNEDDLNTPIYRVQLSFVPSEQIQDYLFSSYTMGSVKLDKSKSEITVSEILFPVSSFQQSLTNPANRLSATAGTSQSARQSVALTQMKGRKLGRYNVKLTDDMDACDITGMEITSDGRRLLEDDRNKKVKLFSRDRKLFSRDMRLLSYLLFSMHPHDKAVLSDQEAVVTTANKSLALLNISGRHMSINTTTSLAYDVYGISQYGEKLVVTSYSPKPASVKLIDMTGRVYWSVSSDVQGKSLFDSPQYVTSDVERSIVTVTDWKNNTLTVLNGETGAVIKRLSLKDKYPEGVTTGPSGNIYVCYAKTREVAVLTGGLAIERIRLSQRDCLGIGPRAIAYDKIRGQLITSYSRFISDHNSVDIWELS